MQQQQQHRIVSHQRQQQQQQRDRTTPPPTTTTTMNAKTITFNVLHYTRVCYLYHIRSTVIALLISRSI